MKKHIKGEIQPNLIIGNFIKCNGTKYLIKQFIGYGEHRFVFELINTKDGCSIFNLLVFRKRNSFEIIQNEAVSNDKIHKQMKMYYIENLNSALRERYDIYNILSDKELLTNIDESLYEFLRTAKYNESILLLNRKKKNLYVLILLSYCHRMLKNEKHMYYLKKLKKKDTNFDFEALLQYITDNSNVTFSL